MNEEQIPRYSEYGTVLAKSSNVALARGTGNWNPPPRFIQTTNRGNASKDAFALYSAKDGSIPSAVNMTNISLADYATEDNYDDTLRKRMVGTYQVGTTGLHSEPVHSWERPEFQGAQNQYVEWALKSTNLTPNTLLNYLFSTENVKYLQQRTINEVKRIRNVDIKEQSVDELLIIMRANYIYAMSGWLPQMNNEYGVHNRGETPCSLEVRLSRLNKSILEETVKQILAGLNQYGEYIKQIQSLPIPLTLPTYTSMAGSRELSESVGFNSGHKRSLAATSYNQRFNII